MLNRRSFRTCNGSELLVIAFVSVLCGASSCAEMAAFGRAKERVFRDVLKLTHAVASGFFLHSNFITDRFSNGFPSYSPSTQMMTRCMSLMCSLHRTIQ